MVFELLSARGQIFVKWDYCSIYASINIWYIFAEGKKKHGYVILPFTLAIATHLEIGHR